MNGDYYLRLAMGKTSADEARVIEEAIDQWIDNLDVGDDDEPVHPLVEAARAIQKRLTAARCIVTADTNAEHDRILKEIIT